MPPALPEVLTPTKEVSGFGGSSRTPFALPQNRIQAKRETKEGYKEKVP